MTTWQKAWGTLICIAICTAWICPLPSPAMEQSVKTSLKRYVVYPYNDQKVLCEPYRVAKDDWLYKIFRQKGEISDSDFPLFLAIFKTLNPGISNIDSINPGQEILIPLKTVRQEEFNETVPGMVDVPMIEFSSLPETLSPHLSTYRVQRGETVSELVDSVFLDRSGNLTEQGIRAFNLANPHVKDINLIYEGSILNLPSPSLLSKTWFSSLFRPPPHNTSTNTNQEVGTKAGLEQYAAMKEGDLIQTGKYYFPRKDGRDLVLDLESTPLIMLKDGSRLVMVGQNNRNRQLETAMEAHWKNLTFVKKETALQTVPPLTGSANTPGEAKADEYDPRQISVDHTAAIRELLEQAGIDYTPDAVISLTLGGIELDVTVEKIPRQGRSDLIVELGEIYGLALEQLREQGYEVISLSPRETTREMAMKLFSNLGITVVENPAFISTLEKRTVTIPGLYITGAPRNQKILVAEQHLDWVTINFLKQKQIKVLYTIPQNPGA